MKINKRKCKNWRYWVSLPAMLVSLTLICLLWIFEFLIYCLSNLFGTLSNYISRISTPKFIKSWLAWIKAGDK